MSKYQNVLKECRKLLGQLEPGAKVPSVRQLMRQFQVSQLLVSQALAELKAANLIVSRVGSGTYKACDGKAVVGLLLPDWQSSFTAKVLNEFSACFESAGFKLRPCYMNYSTRNMTPEMLTPQSDLQALIVYWHHDFDLHTYETLRNLPYTVILINNVPKDIPIHAVCTDNELGGAIAAAHFLQSGHEEIGILLGQPQLSSVSSRRDGFCKFLRLNHITPTLIDCGTRPGESSTARACDAFRNIAKGGNLPFSALFCDSDLGALGVLRACHELRIRIPDDLSIIGFDNVPECEYFHPALSSIDQCIGEWAHAVQEIIQAEPSEPQEVRQVLIQPKLHLRESTQSLKHNTSNVFSRVN